MALRLLVFLLVAAVTTTAEEDWTSKCNKCKCMWSNGKKSADCRNVQLGEIPTDLSSELRDIDFSNNSFYQLKSRTFSISGLQNVHKLRLQHCSIKDVDKLTFDGLKLLIELDLSKNEIRSLDQTVFADNSRLRILNLSFNKLRVLEENMFVNMSHLQRIEAHNNELEVISEETFGENCPLLHLSLENNRLTFIAASFSERLKKIGSFGLAGNPWNCDCSLQPFRKLALDNNWITKTTECAAPERLRGRNWADPAVVFACDPKILQPSPNAVIEVNSPNHTIPCKVEGDPRPSVVWYSNGRSIDTQRHGQKYLIVSSKDSPYWDNLTILNVNYRDRGEYKCIATNAGGSDERNVTLTLKGMDNINPYSSTSSSNLLILVIALTVGAVVLLLVVILLVCCFCKRSGVRGRAMGKNRHLSQDEFISLDGRPGEIEKALITEVNPILKPPRQYSVPPSVTSGGTEVSEAKKMLIDAESIFNGDEESRCYDYIPRNQPKPQNHLDPDYPKHDGHYPPDLLSFPPRSQISPAGSSASTVADTSRLPPLQSPIYERPNHYRTLPYSRSHSPFTPNPPIRTPRQTGYVVLRRPRASWSSEPPNMSDLGEPLYDNLGLRTTATGASALSLNKLENCSTPKGPKGFPLSPQPCDPIAEHESPPTAVTLPRSASAQRALSSNLDLMGWARSPEGESRRESTASLLPTEKTPKIPPRPPPKPKKKVSTGPLFEDEGEDGTEV